MTVGDIPAGWRFEKSDYGNVDVRIGITTTATLAFSWAKSMQLLGKLGHQGVYVRAQASEDDAPNVHGFSPSPKPDATDVRRGKNDHHEFAGAARGSGDVPNAVSTEPRTWVRISADAPKPE